MTTSFHQRLGAYGVTAAITLLGGAGLVRGCAPEPARTNAAVSAPLSVQADVVAVVNQHRANAGVPALIEHGSLATAALGQSQDQARRNKMTHTGANGSNAGARIKFMGFRWSTWGENVAAGQSTASEALTAWMNSAPHRANILSPAFTHIGVAAVASASGTVYWTMDLAAPR